MDSSNGPAKRPSKNRPDPSNSAVEETDEDDWTAFEILAVEHEGEMTLVVGRIDESSGLIHLGLMQRVDTDRGIPGFIRAKPERRGVADFTTLSKLDPIVADAYLDCSEFHDLGSWRAALQGAPLEQNSVGYRMSFGRDRTRAVSRNQFTRPNWLGGKAWLCMAALQGYPSALNNLASSKILAACGIPEQEHEGLRQRLYACAIAFEKLHRVSDNVARLDALEDAAELVALLSLKSSDPQ